MAWGSKQTDLKSGILDSLGCDGLSRTGPEWGGHKELEECEPNVSMTQWHQRDAHR